MGQTDQLIASQVSAKLHHYTLRRSCSLLLRRYSQFLAPLFDYLTPFKMTQMLFQKCPKDRCKMVSTLWLFLLCNSVWYVSLCLPYGAHDRTSVSWLLIYKLRIWCSCQYSSSNIIYLYEKCVTYPKISYLGTYLVTYIHFLPTIFPSYSYIYIRKV